ncbi:MAG: DUF1788 domain-containing protein [Gordonibacter sp.]|uniref:BREX protein BrxB domain-containing protein n=1 Tax=Gordonibacter sp. TaxID=1968902 RepID=UPI002FC858AE
MTALASRRTQLPQQQFQHKCATLIERLADPDFLAVRGLGNEVGLFMFCYDPALELQARSFLTHIAEEAQAGRLPCCIQERNLFDILLELCEEEEILEDLVQLEAEEGTQSLLEEIKSIITPNMFAQRIAEGDFSPGDVVVVTGVGEVYPIARAHAILNNIQHIFPENPVVLFYPGSFDGQTLSLFTGESAGVGDGNYYRAFNLI